MFNYNKGLLAEILEPIMGKGLIPADLETWKVRRRVAAPAFHDQYLKTMTSMFGRCAMETARKFNALLDESPDNSITLNMEDEFLNLALDIIGLGVFNFDFGSITQESPVIKVRCPGLFLFRQSGQCRLCTPSCRRRSIVRLSISLIGTSRVQTS